MKKAEKSGCGPHVPVLCAEPSLSLIPISPLPACKSPAHPVPADSGIHTEYTHIESKQMARFSPFPCSNGHEKWCATRESNPQTFRCWDLNPVRLPISPVAPEQASYNITYPCRRINPGTQKKRTGRRDAVSFDAKIRSCRPRILKGSDMTI